MAGTSDYWGNIRVVIGEMTELGKQYPCIFITDSNKDILYQFNLGYDSELQVGNCKLDDLNQDGLADLQIWTNQGICLLYQRKDGSFIEEWEVNEEVVIENCLYKKWFSRAEDNANGIQLSLYFTQLSEEQVRGRICIGGLAGNECFSMLSHTASRVNLGTGYFEGKVIDGVARCKFQNEDGEEGWLTISFEDQDVLTATVEWEDQENAALKAENYYMEEYNIYQHVISEDETAITKVNERLSRDVNLKKWGNVKILVCESTNLEKGVCAPLLFMTDQEGNLLYQFDVASPSNCLITDLRVEDLNGDSYEDVAVTISVVGEELQYEPLEEHYFYQQPDGMFLFREFNVAID